MKKAESSETLPWQAFIKIKSSMALNLISSKTILLPHGFTRFQMSVFSAKAPVLPV
jgi:hypothetical protein